MVGHDADRRAIGSGRLAVVRGRRRRDRRGWRSRRDRRGWRIFRRALLGVGVLLILLIGAGAIVAWRANRPAKVPSSFAIPTALPAVGGEVAKGAIAFNSDRTGNFEIFLLGADQRTTTQLTKDRRYDTWWPRISPDRRHILFYRTPRGTHDRDFTKTALWVMNADGTKVTQLRPAGLNGWVQQGHAEWAPDGKRLVMFGGSRFNPQIYLTDALGQKPRSVVHRSGTNVDPSFSPDGKRIVFVGCPQAICTPGRYELYEVGVDGRGAKRLTTDNLRDHDPYYSPDGRTLAWLTQVKGGSKSDPLGVWDIRVRDSAGRTRRLLNDRHVTSRPEWSRDGKTIFAHRLEKGREGAFQLYAIRPDGKSVRRLTSTKATSEYPSS